MSAWLSLPQKRRFIVMGNFRHLIQRECFARFLGNRRHLRRLWRLAKGETEYFK